MTIQELGAIGELIGAIAVLATLVYLSVQVRMSAKTQRAQTHQQMAHDRAQTLRMMIENEELRDAIRKASTGQELTENEQALTYWFTTLNVRAYENELFQHSLGMIDDDELDVQRRLLELPHMQIEDVIARSKHVYKAKTQEELETIAKHRREAT